MLNYTFSHSIISVIITIKNKFVILKFHACSSFIEDDFVHPTQHDTRAPPKIGKITPLVAWDGQKSSRILHVVEKARINYCIIKQKDSTLF